jgi:hypothetical protein
MEPFEFIFDYIIDLFGFIKNTTLRTFIQICAMIVITILIVIIIFGVSQLIIWIFSKK